MEQQQSATTLIFKVFGKTEEEVKELLKPHNKIKRSIRVEIEAGFLECKIALHYSSRISKANLDEYVVAVTTELKDFLYSFEDESLDVTVATLAQVRGAKLRTAESFTGGRIAAELTRNPGAGQIFDEGITAYTEEAKMRRLGVADKTIRNNGVVSVETAYEMAAGLITADNVTAVATTGYAGPDAPEGRKGECYIAVGSAEGIHIFGHRFEGDRESIVQMGVKWALWYLYKTLK
ncbi:MAG: CinA family protein [Firmicutes bacterium]|nr:CinA family protein [Bacillota bacterium]